MPMPMVYQNALEILDREEVLKSRTKPYRSDSCRIMGTNCRNCLPNSILAIAAGENAIMNGVEFQFETEASSIEKAKDGYIIHTNKGDMETKAIVNAAGLYADVFHNMVSEISLPHAKGEYLFFDKSVGTIFNTTVVPLPGKMGKGIAASYTINGNFFIGPTATDVEDKEGLNTTAEILDKLKENGCF